MADEIEMYKIKLDSASKENRLMKYDIEISKCKHENSEKQIKERKQLITLCVSLISTLERENKNLKNLIDLQIETNIKSSEDIHVRYTENTDEVTKTTKRNLILQVIKGEVQIKKHERKKREDVKKIAD